MMPVTVPPGDHTKPMTLNTLNARGIMVTVTIPAGAKTGQIITVPDPSPNPYAAATPMMQIMIQVPSGDHSRPMTYDAPLPDGRRWPVTIPAGARTGSTIPVTVPAPNPYAPPPQFVNVVVPPGDHTKPMNITVIGPQGQPVAVTVPAGAKTGQNIQVALPGPPPQMYAPQQGYGYPGMMPGM